MPRQTKRSKVEPSASADESEDCLEVIATTVTVETTSSSARRQSTRRRRPPPKLEFGPAGFGSTVFGSGRTKVEIEPAKDSNGAIAVKKEPDGKKQVNSAKKVTVPVKRKAEAKGVASSSSFRWASDLVDADLKSSESLSDEDDASESDDSWAASDPEDDNGYGLSEDEERDRGFAGVREVDSSDVYAVSEDSDEDEDLSPGEKPDQKLRVKEEAMTRAGKNKRKKNEADEDDEQEEQEDACLFFEEEEEEPSDEDVPVNALASRVWSNIRRSSKGGGRAQKKQQGKRKKAAKAAAWVRAVHLEGEEVEEERMAEWEKELDACNRGEITPQHLAAKRERPREQEPAPDILMPLLPFQKEWLAWSLKQEQGPIKGGILADEMGMGKTIQAISLIVTSRHLQSQASAVTPVPSQQQQPSSSSAAAVPATTAVAPTATAVATAAAAAAAAATATASGVTATSAAAAHATAANPGSTKGGASEPERPAVKATLVICPLVAVLQWRQEIARFTRPDSVKVLVYHGPKRAISVEDLADYDVVLTTFSIVEAEMRATVFPSKVECQWCLRKFFPDRLEIHQKYFCGPNAKRTEKQAKQQKKVPRGFKGMAHGGKGGKGGKGGRGGNAKVKWEEEEDDGSDSEYEEEEEDDGEEDEALWKGKGLGKGKGKGKGNATGKGKGTRKGKGKVLDDDESASEDGVTKAGQTSANPRGRTGPDKNAEKNAEKKPPSVLHAVRWRRIVLDEAHSIKDRRCNTARAVFGLQSDFKWALSGTPLQNRVGELYSLIRFLQIDPYSFYFCRHCDCQSLDHKFSAHNRKCDQCGHSPLVHFCWWNKFVANPIKKHGYGGDGRRAMLLLKHRVLDRILLRRTKTERAADLTLPPRTATLRRDRFDAREEDFYEALYTQSQSQFATYVDTGTLLNNYAHIFDLLIRLRQAVDHPYLVVHSASYNTAAAAAAASSAVASTAAASAAASAAAAAAAGRGGKEARDGGAEGSEGRDEDEEQNVCGICCDYAEDPVSSRCRHTFCRGCITDLIAAGSSATMGPLECPVCSVPLTVDLSAPAPPSPPGDTGNGGKGGRARGKGKGGGGDGDGVAGGGGMWGAGEGEKEGGKGGGREGGRDGGRLAGGVVRARGSILSRFDLSRFQSSTKIEALREEVDTMTQRDPGAKALVFSQFTSMLDLIAYRLHQVGIRCVKLDGSMTMDARDRIISTFTRDADCRVFLMSLKAGGVALNLTVASHVFLMDPWWNPAVEQQAQDRIHRLGQFKPVRVTRFVIAGTIEERIIKLQEKKQLVFDGTVGGSAEALGRLTEDDLRFLFAS
ncbi:hypothetical protein CLOP_g7292 [Closterium sp. NIES-67]|nr:hypothetical protein CLOP_g7292 [Closterium sp. NIES-67]